MDWSPRGRAGCQKNRRIAGRAGLSGVIHRTRATAKDRAARGNLQTVTREITPQQAERHFDALTAIVARAAAATLATPFSSVERRIKDDQSPVTAADEASEAVILEGVSRLLPGIPVISEESVGRAAAARLEPSFVLVDPLDGTREFLAGRDEFTVNVAIVTRRRSDRSASSPRRRKDCSGAASSAASRTVAAAARRRSGRRR